MIDEDEEGKILKVSWDKQPGESSFAYGAFLAFLHLGPKRTIGNAYRAFKQDEASGQGGKRLQKGGNIKVCETSHRVAPSHWEGWYRDWSWRTSQRLRYISTRTR